ncbi:MAG: AAA family ATPase [Chloroflexi bacterium]|nr:MAG: AAA family ATPase [Chloroflexota bacterium]
MVTEWQVEELIRLVRQRYPDWDGFDHPEFVVDEIEPKRTAVSEFAACLNQETLDSLIATGAFEEVLAQLIRLSRRTNLLWQRVPRRGDTAVLFHPHLDKATFATQFRNLLYADLPAPERLQAFSDFLGSHNWPNRWTFATYWLFMSHPQTEIFVKPRVAEWWLKFMGVPSQISGTPTAPQYATLREIAHAWLMALRPFGAQDMVDVQSFIWVSSQEARLRTGRLSPKGQVELDVPASRPLPPITYTRAATETAVLRESASPFTTNPPYTLTNCATETGYPESELARWVQAIERKGQAILYGPPGTGKTFMARQLARHLVSESDGLIELVQFHPAYAYEDFIQGLRPVLAENGMIRYEQVPGRFLAFCHEANQRNGRCVLIIDEINRANLATVFGELMYLLEYRNESIPLAGSGRFHIPHNIRLIGTMNTADRGIALVDHALRRRFAFIHLAPNMDILRHYHAHTGYPIEPLIRLIQRINHQIGDPHYAIGHTFFLHPDLHTHLPDIWRMEIEPYLEEYFFDQPEQVEAFRWEAISHQIG